jgi:hypothetical protein
MVLACPASNDPSTPANPTASPPRITNISPVAGPRRQPLAASQLTAGSIASAKNSAIKISTSRPRSRSSSQIPAAKAATVAAASAKARGSHGGIRGPPVTGSSGASDMPAS